MRQGHRGLWWVAAVLTVAAALWPSTAGAQGFELLRFHPGSSQRTDYLSVESGRAMLPRNWETGLWFQWSDDPLVANPEGREQPVIETQALLHLVNSISFLDRVRLTFDVPLYVSQQGSNEALVGEAPGTLDEVGLGDVRIIPKVNLYDGRESDTQPGLAVALRVPLSLPLGSDNAFQGEPVRVEPGLAADYATPAGWGIALNVGYLIREDREVAALEVTDALTYGLAGRAPIVPERFALVAEVFGALPVGADSLDVEETPLEALGAARLFAGNFVVTAGAGSALTNGVGGPDVRVVGGVAYSPLAERVAEDDDLDDDGVTDDADRCPAEPEDVDGFQDADGCPDPDNDQDGILDGADDCPNDPEDVDGFQDADGCPDPDNDQDGIADVRDSCPDEAEDQDGFEDADGCPEAGPVVEPELPQTPYLLPTVVHFEYDSEEITAASERDLDRIAEALNGYPTAEVEVSGHADLRGSDDYNDELSQRRAERVVDELVERGIDRRIIRIRAAGESEPLDRGDSEAAHRRNRRVEVRILSFR